MRVGGAGEGKTVGPEKVTALGVLAGGRRVVTGHSDGRYVVSGDRETTIKVSDFTVHGVGFVEGGLGMVVGAGLHVVLVR